eukprot:729217-Prymnesium_polylepis.1
MRWMPLLQTLSQGARARGEDPQKLLDDTADLVKRLGVHGLAAFNEGRLRSILDEAHVLASDANTAMETDAGAK